MIKVSVLYPSGNGKRFDMNYYLTSHMPMVKKTIGAPLKGMGVEQGVGTAPPGTEAPFAAIGYLLFDSVDAFGAAFAQHAPPILADIPNYTNIQRLIQVSEIKM